MRTGFVIVNLLPYREKQKSLQIKKFSALMFSFGLVGALLVTGWHVALSFKIENQNGRNEYIVKENEKLDGIIKSIAGLKEEIKTTLAKRKIVESLQVNRADGVNIINSVANSLPDDTYINTIKKVGDNVSLIGQTTSNNKVSHYMTSLDETPIFKNPVLQEIHAKILVSDKSDKKQAKPVEEIKVSEFSLKMDLERSEEDLAIEKATKKSKDKNNKENK